MYTFYNTINPQYHDVGCEFVKVYYDKMAHNGVNTVFELFSPNVLCTVNFEEFKGSYNWLHMMVRAGISRFEYNSMSGTCQPLSNYEILIMVQGNLRAISLWDQYMGSWLQFNETFVLEKNGNSYVIRNYILRIH